MNAEGFVIMNNETVEIGIAYPLFFSFKSEPYFEVESKFKITTFTSEIAGYAIEVDETSDLMIISEKAFQERISSSVIQIIGEL